MSLGCKVNTYDIQAISETFDKKGYIRKQFDEQCDVYIINTCSVTNMAEAKSRQKIRQAITKNPEAVVCVTGCYAQLSSEQVMAIEGVDIVIGTQYRSQLVERVEEYFVLNEKKAFVDDIFETDSFESMSVDFFDKQTRAFVKIQEGCNQFCTYCIIPYARGKMRSRSHIEIIDEIKRLVQNGYVEVVLTGIHTGGYGYDLDNYSFYNLLVDILANVDGLKRLRISSIEINQLSDEIIELIAGDKRIVNHLHIPIQAGSDEILTLMKRHYNIEEFQAKVFQLRSRIDNLAITTDLIVGFPGETDELFKKTYENITKIGFSQLHVFPYSIRTGTPAATMPGQLTKNTKQSRVNAMMTLSNHQQLLFINSQFDLAHDVVIEKIDDEGMAHGHTSNYISVMIDSKDIEVGQLVKVMFESVDYPNVYAKSIKESELCY